MKCFKCNEKVKHIPNTEFLDAATKIGIYPEYGSIYDGEILRIIICDDCLGENFAKISICKEANEYLKGKELEFVDGDDPEMAEYTVYRKEDVIKAINIARVYK